MDTCRMLLPAGSPMVWALPAAAIGLLVCTLLALGLTHCIDPGVIPRLQWQCAAPLPHLRSFAAGCQLAALLSSHPALHCSGEGQPDPPVQNEVGWRLCSTCKIHKPPRSHHCGECDNCVAVFDHHCPWVGTCVALRNYKYFVGFVVAACMLDVLVLGATANGLLHAAPPVTHHPPPPPPPLTPKTPRSHSARRGEDDHKGGFWYGVSISPMSLLLCMYGFMVFFPLWSLATYHLALISKGRTTKEALKGKHDRAQAAKAAAEAADQEQAERGDGGGQEQGGSGQSVDNEAAEMTQYAIDERMMQMHCADHWLQLCCTRPPPSAVLRRGQSLPPPPPPPTTQTPTQALQAAQQHQPPQAPPRRAPVLAPTPSYPRRSALPSGPGPAATGLQREQELVPLARSTERASNPVAIDEYPIDE